jgi:hypothetical protein
MGLLDRQERRLRDYVVTPETLQCRWLHAQSLHPDPPKREPGRDAYASVRIQPTCQGETMSVLMSFKFLTYKRRHLGATTQSLGKIHTSLMTVGSTSSEPSATGPCSGIAPGDAFWSVT